MKNLPEEDKKRLLEFIVKLGKAHCCYISTNWPENYCDCKYGGPEPHPTETTGCPELKDLYTLISQIEVSENK